MANVGPATVEHLRSAPAFAGLHDDQLTTLLPLSHVVNIDTGEELLTQGGPAHQLYVVLGGRIRLCLELGTNHEKNLLTLTRGETIGWSAVLDRPTWLAAATALKPSELLVVDGDQLRSMCVKDPGLGSIVMRNLFAEVAERLQDTRLQLLDMYAQHHA